MKFALAGIGYVAEKHLRAIKDVGGELIAACDIRDSVGILDKYFPECEFFKSDYTFEEYLHGNKPDYLSICTPNDTHIHYIGIGERLECGIICEKPLTKEPNDISFIEGDVNVIHQLRLHPEIKKISGDTINIIYHTPRGKWYHQSWKGQEPLLVNIGIHLFDLMYYLFGDLTEHNIKMLTNKMAIGSFKAGGKNISYDLSITGDKIIREINGADFSNIDLHTKSYEEIIAGRGFKKESVEKVLRFIYDTSVCENISLL